MRLSLGQNLQQVQKQILAPRMIQSMEILQLPIMALLERIEQEMEENPVLEISEESPDGQSDEGEREDQPPPDAARGRRTEGCPRSADDSSCRAPASPCGSRSGEAARG